jgi:L-arabinokinase
MGYRMIAEIAGLSIKEKDGSIEVDDKLWNGYLANLNPDEFENNFQGELPDAFKGSDYITRYGGITDKVTRIDPNRTYPVRAATKHPIFEHFRVRSFSEMIGDAGDEQRLELLGELMYQSHSSYSACGLGSDGTDLLVQLVREAGPKTGLYGAKITGGGSGGTVAVLGLADAEESVTRVANEYSRATGRTARMFSGSSPGSAAFGHLILRN